MKAGFGRSWALLAGGVLVFGAWLAYGDIYVRRKFFAVPRTAEAARTQHEFLAVLMPRVTKAGSKYAMSAEGLSRFLAGLKTAGYTSVGLDDVERAYSEGRPLPRKAILIGFTQEDPIGIAVIDGVMKDLRLRGVIFLTNIAQSGRMEQRRFLTRHAVVQMRRMGAWDFGWSGPALAKSVAEAGGARAVLYEPGAAPGSWAAVPPGLGFRPSELGLNDGRDAPGALNVMVLRPERSTSENLAIVENSWVRASGFSDNFGGGWSPADWVAGWGVIAMRNGRLSLLPTPRQTGAGLFLRGTERWRDQVLEFELERYRKEFWAYARFSEDGRFIRIGAREGYWLLEQKTAEGALPSLLARAPIQQGGLPGRVRLVLKGSSAIVHVNGRMQFGRTLRLNDRVDQGRVLLGVYNGTSRSALGVLTSVRAEPLVEEWIAQRRGGPRGFDESSLAGLREQAVRARVISPSWVSVSPEGGIDVAEAQGLLVRSLAGFYGCRLVPMVDMPRYGAPAVLDPVRAGKLAADLAEVAGALDGAGLNLRFSGSDTDVGGAVGFLAVLRAALNARGRGLWVTYDGRRMPDLTIAGAVDGMLRSSARAAPGLELLDAVWRPQPQRAHPIRTTGLTRAVQP